MSGDKTIVLTAYREYCVNVTSAAEVTRMYNDDVVVVTVVDVLREALMKQITEIHENEPEKTKVKKLNDMLDKSFPVIKNKKLQPVAMHIMKYIPQIKSQYLSQVRKCGR